MVEESKEDKLHNEMARLQSMMNKWEDNFGGFAIEDNK